MKTYTQEEFYNFEVANGIKMCPTGDYSLIKIFGESCSFGEQCSFGESCSFEGAVGIGSEILQIRAGSEMRTSIAFNLDTGIFIRSGCFLGTLDEFINKVKETHIDNKHAKAYLLWVDIIKLYFLDNKEIK